jgi:hypothetical protein
MKKFLENIVHSKLGKILDHLFLGFQFFLPKFVLYLIVPTLILSFMQFFGVQWVDEQFLKTVTLILLPKFFLGAFWFIYRTTRVD